MDYVDRLSAQWAERLPELDISSAGVMARITRIAALLTQQSEATLAAHELSRPEFDVLTTLRRAGRPLRAGEIQTLQRAPGASVTKRLERLTRAGLVERTVPERDRRGVLVSLTDAGVALVDAEFPAQLERERGALDGLSPAEHAELARLLSVVLRAVDQS